MVIKHPMEYRRWLGVAGILIAMLAAILYVNPVWETNDDLTMSMIAHGYGVASQSSPNLLFSNVLWGKFVQLIPEVYGIRGYAIATYFILFLSATVIFLIVSSKISVLAAFVMVALIYSKPILEPQFTLNAGLLAIASVGAFLEYRQGKTNHWLYLSVLLFSVSYLIRSQEALLVIILASPIVLKNIKSVPRLARYLAAFALLAIALFWWIDYIAYQNPSWDAYASLNPVRAAFTDFRALGHVLQSPGVLDSSYLSENDLKMVRNWFFVDGEIANPAELRRLLDHSNFAYSRFGNFQNGVNGFSHLSALYFSLILLAAMVAFFRSASLPLILVWMSFLGVAFLFGIVGRPNAYRVYYPLAVLLLLIPYFIDSRVIISSVRERFSIGAVMVLLLISVVSFLSSYVVKLQQRDALIDAKLLLDNEPLVVWGGALPYQALYSIKEQQSVEPLSIIGLGASTLAPFAQSVVHAGAGQGVINRLISSSGILLVASDANKNLLRTYCDQHHQPNSYSSNDTVEFRGFKISRTSCTPLN
jgi:hypothetical protein